MISTKTYYLRPFADEYSTCRFGLTYQPLLIQGLASKRGKADFIGLHCSELPIESFVPDAADNLHSFLLNYTVNFINHQHFCLNKGCKLIIGHALYECVDIIYPEATTTLPVVIAKELPYIEAYHEPYDKYCSALSSETVA